jgi:peptidyl-prolyl cis-trans isomerase C
VAIPDVAEAASARTEAPAKPARVLARLRMAWPPTRRLLSEPLTHFIIAGAVLFIAGQAWQSGHNAHRVVVTPAHLNQLANDYALQFGARPDGPTMDALVKRDLHDEILYREGVALKLDQDDQIVRRRVVQKMQFLIQDLNAPSEPTDAQLQAYYDAHAAHYAAPARTTFSHIYFSADKGGDATAKARATAVLKTLSDKTARAPDKGDPFPDLYDFSAYAPDQVERLFGKGEFAAAVQAAPVGHWSGPYRSGYGWHLIYVDARQGSSRPALKDVRDQVRNDDLQEAQDVANQQAFNKLAKNYSVVVKDRAGSASASARPAGRAASGGGD